MSDARKAEPSECAMKAALGGEEEEEEEEGEEEADDAAAVCGSGGDGEWRATRVRTAATSSVASCGRVRWRSDEQMCSSVSEQCGKIGASTAPSWAAESSRNKNKYGRRPMTP